MTIQNRFGSRLGHRGFTLVEVMTVVGIIAILAAISIPNYISYRERAYYASLETTLRQLMDAQDRYFIENDEFYPPRGRINIPSGIPRTIRELGFSVGNGHLHRYRFRGVNNRRNNRYIIDVWSDKDFNNNGRDDRFQITTWYRDGEVFRGYHRYIRHWR